PNPRNAVASCGVADERMQLVGGARHRLGREAIPDKYWTMGMISRLSEPAAFLLKQGTNAVNRGRRRKRHEAAGARLHWQGETWRIHLDSVDDELKGTGELGPRRLARIV